MGNNACNSRTTDMTVDHEHVEDREVVHEVVAAAVDEEATRNAELGLRDGGDATSQTHTCDDREDQPSHSLEDVIGGVEFAMAGNGVRFRVHRTIAWDTDDLTWVYTIIHDDVCRGAPVPSASAPLTSGWTGALNLRGAPVSMHVRIDHADGRTMRCVAAGDIARMWEPSTIRIAPAPDRMLLD